MVIRKRTLRISKRKRQLMIKLTILIGIIITSGIILCISCSIKKHNSGKQDVPRVNLIERPKLDIQLLTVNPYSRPGTRLDKIKGIVIHYTANPGTTASRNRNYFEGLKDSKITKASSHFIIGIDGEIIQCIPTNEVAYASNKRNGDTISIECCHPDASGKFTDATYQELVKLTAWLCCEFQISVDDVIRHYDVTGKNCPKYFVENENKWKQFQEDVRVYIRQNNK